MKKIVLLSFVSLILGGCSVVAKTPEPSWSSVSTDGDIEIRLYDQMIMAEVVQTGERYEAINAGFRILAGYIFGDNQAKKKLEMTAPVVQQAQTDEGQKLAMTAPVIQQKTNSKDEWKVAFVMPSEYSLDELPVPNDKQIKFVIVPPHKKAVIRFSGFNTDANLKEHQDELVSWLSQHKMQTAGDPVYAFYNPPWTPFFLKRNEIMIDLLDQ